MNALIQKYKNVCKFCLGTSQELTTLGTKELEDVETIRELMGAEITENNSDFAKVIQNAICFKCASNIIVFRDFRVECNEKYKAFQKEFADVQKAPKEVSVQTFVCEHCYQFFKTEEILNSHKANVHETDTTISVDAMDIDLSCAPQVENVPEEETISEVESYECNDCHRKFLPEDHSIYLAHCRNVHPKKVPCPFGCLVDTQDKDNPVRTKRKLFKNLYFLANHLQKKHFMVKQETVT